MVRMNPVVIGEATKSVAAIFKGESARAQSPEKQAFNFLGGAGLRCHRNRIQLDERLYPGCGTAEGKNPKKIEETPKSTQQSRTSLCSRRNDRSDKIEAVDCRCYAVERRDFARQRVYAKCFGAGSDKDGRATLF